MKKIILSMLALSTMALYSCEEKEAETETDAKEVVETQEPVKINGTYNVAEGSVVTWNARHYKDTEHAHTGTVAISAGSIVVEDGSIISGDFTFDMTQIIEPGTDTTQPWTLEGHLKMLDFFNVDVISTSSFTLSNVADGVVSGTLEVIGVRKDISFPADVMVMEESVTVNAEFELDLLQFGLPGLVEGDALPEAEKLESPNPIVTFQLNISASK